MTPTDPLKTPEAESLPVNRPSPLPDAARAADLASLSPQRRDGAAGAVPVAFAALLRVLTLVAAAACGSLGVVQVGLSLSGRAEGDWLWVVTLSLLSGLAAALLVLLRSPVVGSVLGLGLALLAWALWSSETVLNRIWWDTQLMLALPVALTCGLLLVGRLLQWLIERESGPDAAVVLDHGMATAVLTGHDWPCAKCAYNLRGNLSGVCPECRTPVVLTLTAPRGATTVLLLRVVLVLLMVWQTLAVYRSFMTVIAYYSSFWPVLSTRQMIFMFSTGVVGAIMVFWAGVVLLRSVSAGSGRLADRRLVAAVLQIVAFALATSSVFSVLYMLVWR